MTRLFYATYALLAITISAASGYALFLFLMKRRITSLFLKLQITDKKIAYPTFVNYSSLNGTVISGKLDNKDCSIVFKKEDGIYLIYMFSVSDSSEFFLYNKQKSIVSDLQKQEFMGAEVPLGENGLMIRSKNKPPRCFENDENILQLEKIMNVFPSVIQTGNYIMFSRRLIAGKDLQTGILNKYFDLISPVVSQLEGT